MPTRSYLSFQAKVLIPIVSLLVILFSLTIWLVNQRLNAQMQQDARQTLSIAEGVFRNSLDIRAHNLLLRYQNLVNEPRFKAVAQLAEAKTMTVQLNELLDETGAATILYSTADGRTLAGAPAEALQEFQASSAMSIQQALQGRSNTQTVAVRNQLFNIICIPVRVNDNIVGALTIGVRIDDIAVSEMKSLTRAEIVFLSGKEVLLSTLGDVEVHPQLIRLFSNLNTPGDENDTRKIQPLISSQGEHFLCLAGWLTRGGSDRIGYLLLSSYQKGLQQMESTQRTLWALSLLGILFSSFFVAALIRRIMRPLQQLRESAEAVGKGDFSRRVEVQSNDEFGELAVAFNRMMENLTASRAQAEHALKSLQETQMHLVQSEKLSAIGEFVAGVAHELNNPLTAVVGFSEMLQDSGINEGQHAFTKRIIEGAERCHRIVQSLLSFARQHTPERKWIDINKLIEAVIEIVSYELRTGNIEVVTEFSPRMPRLLIDPHQMQQVFLNILNNARQAIEGNKPSGTIRISTEMIDRKVRITFRDDGPGIDPENLRRIFDPFYTTKPVGVGTGLGLSLSYGIVHEHGGTITVRSQVGAGATFVIELPVPAELEEGVSDTTGVVPLPVSAEEGKGKNVLVIDDEEAILDLLREALGRQGYKVEAVREGYTAIKQFQQRNYDLIVCDWKIPGLSGEQIFERLCELEPRIADRFVFITGDSLNPRAQQFLWSHNRPCLFKPFSMDELHSTIRKVLKEA